MKKAARHFRALILGTKVPGSLMVLIFLSGILLNAQDITQDVKKEETPLLFKAKRHFQDLEKDLITLEGGVELSYGESELWAGKVTLDKKKNQITATENVRLSIPSEETYIKAHELRYNYKTRLGEIINGEVKSGYSVLRGRKIKKIGDKQYQLFKGSYSTCDIKEDETCPWCIWMYKGDVTIGEYATAAHPVFIAGGIPIFYSPFAFFPVKSERQSGFLVPEFGGSSQSGMQLKNSLFLALGRSHDATTSLEYLSKRGFKEGLEYRYVLDKLSSGKFNGYFIQDREFMRDFGYRKRYSATYDHALYLTPNFFNKASVRLVSDDEYVKNFQKDVEGRQATGLETKIFQGLNTENISFNVEGIYYQYLLNEDPMGTNKEIIHRLPTFTMNIHPTEYLADLPFYLGANFSYTNFYNTGDDFKDLNGNNFYNEGSDKLLKAHRTDIFPTLTIPIKVGRYFELIPQSGVRQTHWWLPDGDKEKNRTMLDFQSSLSTNISRIFNTPGKTIQKMKHLIEPKLSHHYSPFVRLDEMIPIFDGVDQIATVNTVSWGLENRLILKTIDRTLNINYFDGLRFGITQDYNIIEAGKKDGIPRPWSDIKSILTAGIANLSVNAEADVSVYGKGVVRLSQGFQYQDPWTNIYRLNHTYNRKMESNAINGGMGIHFLEMLKFNFSLNYSFDKDQFLEKIYQATYFPKTKCWALSLNLEDKKDSGFSFNVGVNILFGDDFLSLARLYQEGERQNLRFFAGQGTSGDEGIQP